MIYSDELLREYNELATSSYGSAKKIIERCAEILVELDHPREKISTKLLGDLPFSDRYIQKVLPVDMKRSHEVSESEQVRSILPRSNFIVYLENCKQIATKLEAAADKLLNKFLENKDKYNEMEKDLNKAEMAANLNMTFDIIENIDRALETEDDRVVVTELQKVTIKMLVKTKSYREIAKKYHLTAKHISNIDKNRK